jgi:cell division control protein 6
LKSRSPVSLSLRAILFPAEVEFPSYGTSELIDIIKDKAQYALAQNSIPERPVELIAVWSNGDARVALQTLRVAAMSADTQKRNEITTEDLKEAFKSARKSKRNYVRSKLNKHQRFLLEVVEKHKRIPSGELFNLYQNSFHEPLGERAYRNQMEYLVQTDW